MTLGTKHVQILDFQTLQTEHSDESDVIYNSFWLRVEAKILTGIKNRLYVN